MTIIAINLEWTGNPGYDESGVILWEVLPELCRVLISLTCGFAPITGGTAADMEGRLPYARLLQLRVLRLGLLQDGNVGVGVFPEREEILICGSGFGGVALQHVGAGEAEMRECADGFVQHNPAMVEDFLELGGGFAALMRGQIGFAAHVNGVHGGPTVSTGCRLS